MFEDLVHNGKSLYEIADDLNTEGVKAHQRAKYWHTGTLAYRYTGDVRELALLAP